MKALKDKLQKELKNENLTGEELKELLLNNNNGKVEKVLDEYIENLSIGIANLINIFEPQTISIGGSFVFFKDILLDRLVRNLKEKNMLFNNQEPPKIITAKLKNNAGIIGSVIEYKD